MIEMIALTLGLDDYSVLQIVVVAGVCSFVVSQRLDGWMGPILCTLGLFGAALISNMLARKYGIIVTANKQIDGIFFTTAGLLAGIVGLLGARLGLSQFYGVTKTNVHDMRHEEALRAMDRTLN